MKNKQDAKMISLVLTQKWLKPQLKCPKILFEHSINLKEIAKPTKPENESAKSLFDKRKDEREKSLLKD